MRDEDAVSRVKEELREKPLRIGVSTRSLFSLELEHKIFETQGVDAYCKYQIENEMVPIPEGAAFEVIKRLLSLNEEGQKPYIEIVVMSKNSPDLSLRAFNSITKYGLNIKLGSFTSCRSLSPYLPAWNIDLFLSNDDKDVQAAAGSVTAAAKLGPKPTSSCRQELPDEVRIAFDGDAVVFSDESDLIFKNKGLTAFIEHETLNAQQPMSEGPFGGFLKKLSKLRAIYMNDKGVSKVRIGIVTARNAPAHARVVHTFRAWGTPADEAHFVGPNTKGPILKAMGAHIFFDDQLKHVTGAADAVPAGHVPGPHSSDELVIPAG